MGTTDTLREMQRYEQLSQHGADNWKIQPGAPLYDTIVIVRISLVNCSTMLDMVIGKTFSLPKKYPLIILDTAIKGSVVPIASNG